MSSSSYRVSVVMCTYNGSSFLDEQIASILKQDYTIYELIIADDLSTDDTWQKLELWQKNNNIIKTFRNDTNLGYNKNFEKAIQLAAGDLIALSDQDDIWLPQKISKLVNTFSNNDTVLAHCRSVKLENGRLRYKSASLHTHFAGNDTRKLFMFNQINGHNIMFRKELVPEVLPIPTGMMYDWWIAVIATCYGNISSVDEYLVHHRIHSENNFFNKNLQLKKKQLDLPDVLQLFTSINALSVESKAFLHEFLRLLIEHNKNEKGFDVGLFRFLYKNGKIIFGHKRRLFPKINYLKNAVKYARFNFKGKGITI